MIISFYTCITPRVLHTRSTWQYLTWIYLQIVEVDGKQFVKFYGMSSATAMEKHSGGVATYRASEGKTVLVSYKVSTCYSTRAAFHVQYFTCSIPRAVINLEECSHLDVHFFCQAGYK